MGSMSVSEVETSIDIEVAKRAIRRELAPTIIICMEDGTHTRIILGIVPYDSKASDSINV